jgi:membrane fusion protein, copper/silver efflux system
MRNPVFVAGLPLVAVAFLAGTGYGRLRTTAKAPSPAEAKKAAVYACPMHPAYRSDKPGKAPCCGMDLELVASDAGNAEKLVASSTASADLDARRVIGVAVAPVEKAAGTRALRLFGRVVPDEGRVYKLNAGIDGFIKNVSPVTTGTRVRKDQVLATFSAPNGQGVIQTYIVNLGAQDRFRKAVAEGSPEGQSIAAANGNVQQRIDQMSNMGVSARQMEEIDHARRIPAELEILAPADGIVLSRSVSPGLKFDRGTEWYRIADLNRVWVLADVFESEARDLRPGARARVSVPGVGTNFTARVAEVLPQFDPASRTLKVRLEVDNPGLVLLPEMFVDVELSVAYPATVTVPLEAVLDSGLRKTVFVERSEGTYEPREVKTGWRFGEKIEVVEGLSAGERIVVAGTFFLDSESRMKPAATIASNERRP